MLRAAGTEPNELMGSDNELWSSCTGEPRKKKKVCEKQGDPTPWARDVSFAKATRHAHDWTDGCLGMNPTRPRPGGETRSWEPGGNGTWGCGILSLAWTRFGNETVTLAVMKRCRVPLTCITFVVVNDLIGICPLPPPCSVLTL